MVQMIRQAAGPVPMPRQMQERARGGVKMRQLSKLEHWFRLCATGENAENKQKTNHMGE
jgi:hypothetical protein